MLYRLRTARLFVAAGSKHPFLKEIASKARYSTTSSTASSTSAGAGTTPPPSSTPPPHCYDGYYPFRYGGWGRNWSWNYGHPGPRKGRRGGFFFFLLAFGGGMWAQKILSDGCGKDRWERQHSHSQHEAAYYSEGPYVGPSIAKVDVQQLPVVTSLRENPEYEEVHILDNQIISPTTNSTFDDSIILPSKPIEFANSYTGEKLAVVTLPVVHSRHGRWSGFGRRGGYRYGGQNGRLVMLVDEYMKQNAALFLNVPKSAVFTKDLDVDCKTWWNPHENNVILKAAVDKSVPKDSGLVVIKGSIMSTDGKLISRIQGSFTSDSAKAPASGQELYHFRKWMWSD